MFMKDILSHQGYSPEFPCPSSNPNTLAPQYVHAGRSSKPKPLRNVADDTRDAAGLVEAAPQESIGVLVTRRPVVRHEELGRGVDHGETAALRVPGRVDGRVARQEVDLIDEEGQLMERGRDMAWLSHHGEGPLPLVVHFPVP